MLGRKMLVLLTILAVLSAIVSIAVLLKNRQTLTSSDPPKIEPPPYRPLFEPDEEEISAFEKAEKTRLEAEKLEEAKRVLNAKKEKLRGLQRVWQDSPTTQNTIALLLLAAQCENGRIFSETTDQIIKFWRENRIKNLSAGDLADLLDSHFRILPQQERTSGALFRLREEIAGLRS